MKHIFLLFSLLFTFTLLSCQDDADRDNRTGTDNFQLSYTIPGATSVITRSDVAVVNGEDQINSFYILFFENDTEGAGEFVAAIDLKEYHQGALPNSGILEIELPKSSGLSGKDAYKILACANIEAYHPSIENLASLEAFCQGRTEQQVKQSLQPQVEGVTSGLSADEEQEDDSHQMAATNLPMSASIAKQTGQSQVAVDLVRAVSRFDVVNQASGYELESASLWNAATSTLLWNENSTYYSGDHTGRYYGVKATDNRIIGGLYSFENFVEQPAQNDTESTALVIGMRNVNTGQKEYFRINIYALDKSQKLRRNNVYTSTIREVAGPGFLTEREAYESSEDLLVSDINGWTTELGDNVVYDDDNILAMPTSVITLAMAGDTRTYNIFTDGEGTLEMDMEGIPSNVTVSLVNENQVKIDAPVSSAEWSGLLTFSLGNLTLSMRVEQREYITNYLSVNFDVAELPALGYEAGAVSDDIEVISSGAWVAQLYGDNYFSLSASGDQTVLEGESGTHFTIYATQENKTTADRRGFIIFTLKDDPEITRVMVIQQAKYEEYIRFISEGKGIDQNPHTYTGVILESNAEWEIYEVVNISGGDDVTITFEDDNGQTVTNLKGKGTKQLSLAFKANPSIREVYVHVIRAKTKGGKTDALVLYQRNAGGGGVTDPADPEPTDRPMWFVTYGTGNGNLANPSADGYKQYVYTMGQNMRNSTKFGSNGNLANIGKNAFQYTTSLNSTTIGDAKVIQLLANPSSSNFDRIHQAMQEDPTMFLMITSDNANTVNSILREFRARTNAAYGSAVQVPNPATNYRSVNANSNKLMSYIMDGPAGRIGTGNVALRGATSVSVGLPSTAYPSTFIPIIMSNTNNYYCVFGIDPVNRLIIMGDPGIFGPASAYSAYPSSRNFTTANSGNWTFLDNLTAWIMHATGTKGFLQTYQQ